MRLLLVPLPVVIFPVAGRRVDITFDAILDRPLPGVRAIPAISDSLLDQLEASVDRQVFTSLQGAPGVEPIVPGVHDVGSICAVHEMSRAIGIVECLERGRIRSVEEVPGGRFVNVVPLLSTDPALEEVGESMRRARDLFTAWAAQHRRIAAGYVRAITSPSRMVFTIASFGPFRETERQALLESLDVADALERVIGAFSG